jgi:phosphatidate cytidylyltransferase
MNQEHKKRWIAAVFGLIFLFGTYFALGHWGLVLITVAVSTACYMEFLGFSGASKSLRWGAVFVGTILSAWLCLELPGPMAAFFLAALLILLRTLWQVHRAGPGSLSENFLHAQARVFGLVYMVLFLSFVPKIHSMPHGPWLLLFLLLLVWLGDTSAYYGGKLLGRRKLSPNVSPGKTLEGAATALASALILAVVYGPLVLDHLAPWKLVVIAFLVSPVAQAGDLLESLMKRAYQVKDSGGLIPGHGGVFDRFDSLILAAPFFYFLLQISA